MPGRGAKKGRDRKVAEPSLADYADPLTTLSPKELTKRNQAIRGSDASARP